MYVADFAGNTVRKITPAGVVTTLAGSAPSAGSADGTGSAARFNCPQGIACDAAGNVYVADTFNDTIRKVTPAGEVTTLAGSPGMQGSADGTGSAARFYWPTGIACDAAGTIYVADYGNDTIRRITPSGVVTTVAGSVGVQGSADGTGSVAGLFHPEGVACDAVGNLYIADFMNDTIRKAVCPATAGGFIRVTQSSGGTISLAGQTGAAPATVPVQHGDGQSFTITPDAGYHIVDVVADGVSQGPLTTLYTFSGVTADHTITASFAADQVALTLTTVGQGSVAKVPDQATYDYGSSVQLTVNADPGWEFTGWSGDAAGKVNPLTVTMGGAKSIGATFVATSEPLQATTFAGFVGIPGSDDGTGSAARFSHPFGVACDAGGNVYVADADNNTIRKITPAGVVTTLAGLAGSPGSADGTGSAARFNYPFGVACDVGGNVYVADAYNNTIRKTTPAGVVTTLAGLAGSPGNSDGTGSAARFSVPIGVACSASGIVYVADYGNHTVRRITPAGVVTTLAGSADSPGSDDGNGSAARFNQPAGVACDADGNVYISDSGNNTIRQVTSAGVVTTLAGSAASASGSDDGTGSAARFSVPIGVACSASGIVYVADYGNHTVRRITPAGVVTTPAGSAGNSGSADGMGSAARFNQPAGVACSADANIYIADEGSSTIRKAFPASAIGGTVVVTPAGGGTISVAGQTDAAPAQVAVEIGDSQTFTITPDAHHHVVDVVVDGVSQGQLTSYTFSGVTADHTIAASFAVDQAVLTVTTVGHGGVVKTPERGTYDYGSPVRLTATADPGWQFVLWSGDVASVANPLDVTVNGAMNVTATFVLVTHTLTASAGAHGGISPAGEVTVNDGADQSFTITPDAHCHIGDVVVDGHSQGPITSYNFTAVTQDHTITASFAVDDPALLQVTTLAGSPLLVGSDDGAGSAARFNGPFGVACDSAGNVYVGDCLNGTIRKITPAGVVTTFAGSAGVFGSANGLGSAASFNLPFGVACDTADNVYVADFNTIRKITPAGMVSTLAGSPLASGSTDGTGSAARFDYAAAVACDSAGNVYVAERDNNTIRKITPAGVVTTLAGSPGITGSTDGSGSAARFKNPYGIACDSAGNLYVADSYNNTIRKVTQAGVVTTIAGQAGPSGSADGAGIAARFCAPYGIACDVAGNVYVADTGNYKIRKITAGGVVSTVAGLQGVQGGTDGTGAAARFYQPEGIACDVAGNIYVADYGHHTIRKGVHGGTISVAQAAGGTISLGGQTEAASSTVPVQHGDAQTFFISADADYHIVEVTVDGASRGALATYTFSSVTADHTITASFAVDTFTLTYAAGSHGSITGTTPQTVDYGTGGTQVTAVPDSGYHFVTWSDGVGTAARTDSAIAADLNVTASFAVDPVAPAVTSPNGGENWAVGSSQTISWTPGTGGNVTVELSRDNGANWETLFASTANDGSQSWTVSGPAASQALVRVSNDAGSDTSDTDFTIGLFAAKVDYATGSQPYSVAAGDFNRDGKQDLVTANYYPDNSVSILLGDGSGGFGAKADFATGAWPNDVAVGDFNGDGKQDLVTANYKPMGSVSVLLGSGDGTFAGYVEYSTGGDPLSVAVGDFDGDGKQDLATANKRDNSVSVLLGDGSGSFGAKTDYATGSSPTSVAVGDFDCDGKQDLVTANHVGDSVSVLLGDGSGGFTAKTDHATGARPYSVAVGDFNRDGKQDLVTANHIGNTVSVLLGDGSGDFAGKTDYATGGTYPTSVAVGDFNGDGKRDLVTARMGDDIVSVLLGDGSGGFAGKTDYATGSYPYDVTVEDYNGDGKQDLATANGNGDSVSVLLNTPDVLPGAFQLSAPGTYSTGAGPFDVALADFDRDGTLDYVTANMNADALGVRLGNGDGTFQAEIPYTTGDYPAGVAVGDLNNDGRQDLVTANTYDSTASVLLGNGDGSFQPKADFPTGTYPRKTVLADVNEDGRLDVITVNSLNTISVLLGQGDGTLLPESDYPVLANGQPCCVVTGDLNGDGSPDLAVSNQQQKAITVLFNDGNGAFLTKTDYPTAEWPNEVAVADLNRDASLDLVYAVDMNLDKVGVRLGNGDGTFRAEADYPTDSSPYAIAVADLDRDGRQDVVTGNLGYYDTASVLLGVGDGSLQGRSDFGGIDSPYALAVGDLDRDGRLDVVAANYYANTINVLLNRASP